MNNQTLISKSNPKAPVVEAYRMLRTNLNFLTVENGFKTVLVTSAGQSEGKSTVTANLGVVMAQFGMKVIIVDCDFRRAQQHTIFKLPNQLGLVNVMTDELEPDQVIQETEIANLRVITSGPLPPNPAELIGLGKTRTVFNKLKEMADIVLVDSPPVLLVTDACLLATVLDRVLLVAKSAQSKLDDMKHTKTLLEKANARILGTVLNAIKGPHGSYYHYDKYY